MYRVAATIGLPITEHERQQYAAAEEALASTTAGMREHFAGVMDQFRPALIKLPNVLQQIGQWSKAVSERLAPFYEFMNIGLPHNRPITRSPALGKLLECSRMKGSTCRLVAIEPVHEAVEAFKQ